VQLSATPVRHGGEATSAAVAPTKDGVPASVSKPGLSRPPLVAQPDKAAMARAAGIRSQGRGQRGSAALAVARDLRSQTCTPRPLARPRTSPALVASRSVIGSMSNAGNMRFKMTRPSGRDVHRRLRGQELMRENEPRLRALIAWRRAPWLARGARHRETPARAAPLRAAHRFA